MATIVPVSCALIVHDRKVLVTQRSAQMKMPLKWEFPGGKIEAGETAAGCLIREIKEELCIDIELLDAWPAFQHDYAGFRIVLYPFIAKITGGDIILKEHAQFIWAGQEELPALDWADADRPVVQRLLDSRDTRLA